MLKNEALTKKIIGAAIEVRKHLGPGLLESTYEACLCCELEQVGLRYQRQVPVMVKYKDCDLECGYRIDVLVEDAVVLELKSVEKIDPIHEAQLMSYLKLSGKEIGLLINFNSIILVEGIRRRVI